MGVADWKSATIACVLVMLLCIILLLVPGRAKPEPSQPVLPYAVYEQLTQIEHQYNSGEVGAVNSMTEVRKLIVGYNMNPYYKERLHMLIANAVLDRTQTAVVRYSALGVVDDFRQLMDVKEIKGAVLTMAIGDPDPGLRDYASDVLLSDK